jgi:hypothetical protein
LAVTVARSTRGVACFAVSAGAEVGAATTAVADVAFAIGAAAACTLATAAGRAGVVCSAPLPPAVASTMIVAVQCLHFSDTFLPAIRRAKMSSDIDISARQTWHLTKCDMRVLP